MSPKWLTPISSTAASSSGVSRNTVIGRPSSLLKFPSVFRVRSFTERTDAIISFVDVFPTDPVMPTTGVFKTFRYSAAILPSASTVFPTRIHARKPPAALSGSLSPYRSFFPAVLSVRTQTAPWRNTAGMKSFPSTLVPAIAPNKDPGPAFLLSVTIEDTSVSRSSFKAFFTPDAALSAKPQGTACASITAL